MENLHSNINKLNISKNIKELLGSNNINSIFDLCHYSRTELVRMGIDYKKINEIIISLQLLGFNLKPNNAKRNSLLS